MTRPPHDPTGRPAALAPTPAAPARVPAALALVVAFASACGGDVSAGSPGVGEQAAAALKATAPGADHRAEQARARADALVATPGPETLLAALAQGHAEARELLGPHRLRYSASYSIKPREPTRPTVDQPIQQEQQVVDDLLLAWGSSPGEPVRMHLSQKTDKGEGREVVILDEQVYTRLAHRGWRTRALDSELHGLWLDEAQHCVHDLVELAAPALALTVKESGDALEVTLRRADAPDPARVAAGLGREWRHRTEITDLGGTITLARATGLWRSADLTLRYVIRDVLERPQDAEVRLTASVEAPPATPLVIEAPPGADPVPERVRLEVEKQRLLGGLAGS